MVTETQSVTQPAPKQRRAKRSRGNPDVRIADLLAKQAETLERISERLSAVEGRQPQIVPMRREPTPAERDANTYVPPEQLMKRAMKGVGPDQQASGQQNWLESPEGLAKVPPRYRPAFHTGDMVRINPDAKIHGSDHLWGTLLQQKGIEAVGEVMGIQYMTRTWEPKYSVYIKGFTAKSGDGFRESELLPYA